MTSTAAHHVAVWLDHHEARVFRIDGDAFDKTIVWAPLHHVKRHPDRNAAERNHPADATRFFHEVAVALHSADEVLVVGPSTAKLHFLRYVHAHDAKLEQRIVGMETAALFPRHRSHPPACQ